MKKMKLPRKLRRLAGSERSGSDFRRRSKDTRGKTDWAGVSIADAHRPNLDYWLKHSAKRKLSTEMRKASKRIAKITGTDRTDPDPKVKPQLSAAYSDYPANQAALAAVGQTGFLEFKARVPDELVSVVLQDYLENPAMWDEVSCDVGVYKKVAEMIAKWVNVRLLFEDLGNSASLPHIEFYRLFSTSEETMKFETLSEIARVAILYADVMPATNKLNMHPFTKKVFDTVADIADDFLWQLEQASHDEKIEVCASWVKETCRELAEFLPNRPWLASYYDESNRPVGPSGERKRFSDGYEPRLEMPPTDEPLDPLLFEPETTAEKLFQKNSLKTKNVDGETHPEMEALNELVKTLEQVTGQAHHEDTRSDLVQEMSRKSPFTAGPVQGDPADGQEVKVQMGDKEVGGELYDRPVELLGDSAALDKLMEMSNEMTGYLKRSLYPNVQELPIKDRLRTSRVLNSSRLPLADIVPTVFHRYRIEDLPDRRGKPVLLIACDGSGSLNEAQMTMMKILTMAWIRSTAKTEMLVLSALYHSAEVRPGLHGPLVQWLKHPQKTDTSLAAAMDGVASLSHTGSGAQSDALSISFCLDESYRLAKGNSVYLVLITDMAWNLSFNMGLSGKDEVYTCLYNQKEQFDGRLHTTMVGLGVTGETGFEDLADNIVSVSREDLEDPTKVAEQIGKYVVGNIRERKRFINRESGA